MDIDRLEYRRRERRTMSASLVAHLLLMMWIMMAPHDASQGPTLTEFTLIEPGEPGAASPAPSAPTAASGERPGVAVTHRAEETFRRVNARDEMTPEPQSATALADRITARLAALHASESAPVQGVASAPLAPGWGTRAATDATLGAGNPLALNRGGSGAPSGPALALHRGGRGTTAAVVATGLPVEPSGATPARGGEATMRRAAAGAMLAGPIADRPVIDYTKPAYPEWAKRDAVEGSVTLYFIVRPDGAIRENILVQKTAGFEDFDDNARTALRAWRFAPLREGRTGDQWGTITFHYRLQEAG